MQRLGGGRGGGGATAARCRGSDGRVEVHAGVYLGDVKDGLEEGIVLRNKGSIRDHDHLRKSISSI